MSVKLGMDAKLYRNDGTYEVPDWVEMTNVKDLTLNNEKGEADVTTRANNGWRATVGTLKDGSVEFEMVWDTEDESFTAIQEAYFGNTSIEFAVMDGDIEAAGSQGLRATMSIMSFSRNEPLEGRAVHVAAGVPAVVVAGGQAFPALAALAGDVRLARFALRIERVELLFESFVRRLPRVDGTADGPRISRHFCHSLLPSCPA